MALWWGATGSGVVARTETAVLTGTAKVYALPAVYVSGTGTADRTTLAAWAAQIRRTATRVAIGTGATDLLRLRDAVSIDVDSSTPVATATFRVSDARCAYFAAGSIATGGIPVAIRCRIETDAAEADTAVFSGLTEALTNEDPYVPTASIQCAGEGAEWLEAVGCISLAAFGGYTRGEVLRAFAEAAGIDASRIVGGEDSATVYLALDLSGLSVWELARRFGEIEDWYVRPDGDELHILPAAQVVGSEATPIFDFKPSNYFSVREDPPSRPVTRYVLSAVGIPVEYFTGGTEEIVSEIQGGTDALGVKWETTTTTTTVNGIVISQVIEEWKDVAIPGVTPSAVAWRLWRRTTTETDWTTVTVNGVSLRTARIDWQATTVEEWYSPPCQSAAGFVWDDNTRHVDASATFQVVSESETTYTYDAAPSCLMSAKTTRTGGWYSEIVASGGYAYDGGELRNDASYQWTDASATTPLAPIEERYAEETSATVNAVESEIVTSGWRVPPGSASVAEEWGERTGSRTRWSTSPGSGVVSEATEAFAEDGSTTYSAKTYIGRLPALTRAAADVPQYRTEPLVLTAESSGDRYAYSQKTETVFDAESMDELTAVARRRFRDTMSPRVTILHPALPLLKVYDVVTVTDPARELDEKQGYVHGYRLQLDPLNGGLRQETTIVFPLPEYAPEAA